MVLPLAAFGSWLLGQLANAARKGLSERLVGSEQERTLDAAARAAIERTAGELGPDGSDEDIEHLEAVLDQVFRVPMPAAPLEEQSTILQALQAAIAAQLAVLDDPDLTGIGQSSAAALGLPVKEIAQALVGNLIQEILSRGAGGGPLASLASQLNHDLTHLQGERTEGMLRRLVEELARQRTAAQPVPRELPRPIADFAGRTGELATLRDLLTVGADEPGTPGAKLGQPVVISAIDGMGGIGKSALAIQAAHELVDGGAFPDGQLYVHLQAATPGLTPLHPLEALGQMLRSLGMDPMQIPWGVEEAAARLRSLVADRRLLFVLDNAGSPAQIRPLLPATPTCAALVTSRQVLATLEGARRLHLDVLPHDQALELLGRIAGPGRVEADPDAAAAIVEHCGHLPLAIRIAGARLVARPGWTPAVLVARLAHATRRLEELEVGELAVRASFEVSLSALEESPDPFDRIAAAAFGLLSLPDGPDLGVVAAAQLLDQSEDMAQRLLERLVDAQLLETPRPGRYQFHDLVRLYARQFPLSHHPESERLAALTRILGFFTATAWHTFALLRPGDRRLATADPRWTTEGLEFPDASAALSWVEAERANLVAAIPQVAAAAPAIPPELAGQLTRALFGFFFVRGYWQDGLEANGVVLELARRTQDLPAQAHAQNNLGVFYWLLGRYEEAIACHRDSLVIKQDLGDRDGEGASLTNLGIVHERLGQFEEALACHQKSLTIVREFGDRHGVAGGLGNLGIAYECLEQYEKAIDCYQEGLTIFRNLGDHWGEAAILGNLGIVHLRLEQYEKAITFQQNSLTIKQELGDRRGEGASLNNLGIAYGRLGRYEEAIPYHQKSLTIDRELGDRHGEAESLRDLGDALQAVGRNRQAEEAWREALTICEALHVPEADEIRERLATLPLEVTDSPDIA